MGSVFCGTTVSEGLDTCFVYRALLECVDECCVLHTYANVVASIIRGLIGSSTDTQPLASPICASRGRLWATSIALPQQSAKSPPTIALKRAYRRSVLHLPTNLPLPQRSMPTPSTSCASAKPRNDDCRGRFWDLESTFGTCMLPSGHMPQRAADRQLGEAKSRIARGPETSFKNTV